MDDTTLALDVPIEEESEVEEAAVQVWRSLANLGLLRQLGNGIGISSCMPPQAWRTALALLHVIQCFLSSLQAEVRFAGNLLT